MLKKISITLLLSIVLILTGCQSDFVTDIVTDVVQDTAKDMVRDAVNDKKEELTNAISDKASELVDGVPILKDEISLGNNEVTNGNRFSAKVTKVTDGDTIAISYTDPKTGSVRKDTVRILNIDTPEVHGSQAVQEFGPEASDFAKELLSNKTIEIEVSAKDNPYDKYDRLLAYVFIDGKLYQELIVKEGFARIAYVYQPDTKYMDQLEEAENHAKENNLGIWGIPGYVTDKGFDMNKAS